MLTHTHTYIYIYIYIYIYKRVAKGRDYIVKYIFILVICLYYLRCLYICYVRVRSEAGHPDD